MEKLFEILPKECSDDINALMQFISNIGTGEVTEWKGHRFAIVFRAETIKYACTEWKVRDGDVIIASYPRSGTHLAKECVRQLLYGNDDKLNELSDSILLPLLYIESGPVCSLRLADKIPLPRRIFITHLPTNLLPLEEWFQKDIRIINIYRNPKDQAVSWYHFSQHFPYAGNDRLPRDWSPWLEKFMSGETCSNMKQGEFHPDFLLTWYKYWTHPKVLPLSYENLTNDLIGGVKKIASFIGRDAGDEEILQVAEKCMFPSMKKALFEKKDFLSQQEQKMEMIRKGGIGGWKNYFTVSQSEKMDKVFSDKLSGTDIKFTYEPTPKQDHSISSI